MAAPRNGLGAHDDGAFAFADLYQIFERLLERVGLHVVGVAAKTFVAPAGVRRIRICTRSASAEAVHPDVADGCGLQFAIERVAPVLRVAARLRNLADVSEFLD